MFLIPDLSKSKINEKIRLIKIIGNLKIVKRIFSKINTIFDSDKFSKKTLCML